MKVANLPWKYISQAKRDFILEKVTLLMVSFLEAF